MKDEVISYYRELPFQDGLPRGIDEDDESDFVDPFSVDIWLWEKGFNLEFFDNFMTDPRTPKDLTREQKLEILKTEITMFRNKYRLFCRESSLDDDDEFVVKKQKTHE